MGFIIKWCNINTFEVDMSFLRVITYIDTNKVENLGWDFDIQEEIIDIKSQSSVIYLSF